MQGFRLRSITRSPWRAVALVASGLCACSFQDFDYLKNEAGIGGAAGEGGRVGLGGGSGGASETGGKLGFGGGAGARFEITGGEAGQGGGPSSGGGGASGDGGSEAGSGGSIDQGTAGESGAAGAGGNPGASGSGGSEPHGGTAGGGGVMNKALVNPSFEQGLTGWTVDPPEAISKRHVYTQAPTSGSTTVDGNLQIATWHEVDEYQLYVYQTLSGLEDGKYTLKGNFSSTQSRGAHLFARNCGGADRQETILTTQFTWFEVAIAAIEVSGGSCEVGFFVHNAAQDWLNADLFSFERDIE